MNAMPSKKDQYHARKTLRDAERFNRRIYPAEAARMKSLRRIGERLAELQMQHGGRFYWRNGIVRHVTLHPTKGFRDGRYDEFLAPLANGFTVQAREMRA